jgi:GH25 family lysozyme M1 (1,4-beta-N-acetylmuramidase)
MFSTPSTRRSLRVCAIGAGALLTLLTPVLTSPASATPSTRLTGEAAAAGLQPGNATMGWHDRAAARSLPRMGARSATGSSAAAKAYVPTGVLGIDVASYQGKVNWASWKAKGKSFAYVKATEGTSYKNPYFAAQYGGAAKAGLIRGAYHFASPNGKAGYLQARYFVAHGGGWTATGGQTLPGVLDIEYNPYGSTCYGLSKKKMVAWISSFTREYKKLTGKDAVIYTTTDWWKTCTGATTTFTSTNPLWVARYGTTSPGALPGSWKTATFWQYTSSPIDSDRFSNTYARLKVLATVR